MCIRDRGRVKLRGYRHICVRDIITNMSTNDNKTLEVSATDENLTSEMDVPLTQISQIGESSTTAFVQSETITITSISSLSLIHI